MAIPLAGLGVLSLIVGCLLWALRKNSGDAVSASVAIGSGVLFLLIAAHLSS